jgi:hypothetical protein
MILRQSSHLGSHDGDILTLSAQVRQIKSSSGSESIRLTIRQRMRVYETLL